MPTITPYLALCAPLGREQIDLAEVVHDAGGMPLLRVRIRENKRFTILDIDPMTAQAWGEAMRAWGASRRAAQESAA